MNKNEKQIGFIRDKYIPFIEQEIFSKLPNNGLTEATHIVAVFFLKKATKTLGAIGALCQNRFAEDALVLGRTLLELCLHLQNIGQPELPEDRKKRAESFIYDGDRQRVEKLKEVEKLKQEGKCLSWINDLMAGNPVMETVPIPKDFVAVKKLKDIAAHLGGEMECYYHFIYWSVSKLTHPSGLGSHTYIQETDIDSEISRAVAVAFSTHYFLTHTALSLLSMEAFREKFDDCAKQFLSDR